MDLAAATWPTIAEMMDSASVALLPIGSTEQHGPHLPTGTDHVIAKALATAASERTDAFRLPTLPIGVSGHHRHFPGTLWVDGPRFRQFVRNWSKNIAAHDIRKIIFVNAHGGNVEPLREVGRDLHREEVAFATEWMWNESIPDLVAESFERPGPHAGPKETAMMLHIDPETVDTESLEHARDHGVSDFDFADFTVHGSRIHYDTIDNSPNGSFGDPTEATAAIGEQLFTAARDELVALVEWLEEQPLSALLPQPPIRASSSSNST